MKKLQVVIDFIDSLDLDVIYYLPCSTFKPLLNHYSNQNKIELIPINREDEGIGLITGSYLVGLKSLLLIQDSGLGNSYNSIVSLLELYSMPVVIFASIRGYYNEISAPNAIWSDKTSNIHNAINIKELCLDDSVQLHDWRKKLIGVHNYALLTEKPVIVKIDFVEFEG